jgi:hypothetical protein
LKPAFGAFMVELSFSLAGPQKRSARIVSNASAVGS